MKHLSLILITFFIVATATDVLSQDKKALKAAEMSYKVANNDFKKGDFNEAAQKFDFVVTTIPANIDSRKHLELRLESLIQLIDIRFYKSADISKACEYLGMYDETINTARNSGTLKSTDLLKYFKKMQEYSEKEVGQCAGYERVGTDMEKFRKKFDKEFDENFD